MLTRPPVAGFALLLFALPATAAPAQDDAPAPEPPTPIAAGKAGLLVGVADTPEPPATTREEQHLCLKPYPGMSTKRPFWLYVPAKYDAKTPAPIVIVLHPRGRLGSFAMGQGAKPADLERYARATFTAWKPVAAKHGFLAAFPIAEPDILHMGRSWQTRDRILVVRALLKQIATTHPYDPKRVYLVGSGEGGHAVLCTAVRHGDTIAACAAANPPLFDGTARRPRNPKRGIDIMMPETVPEMLAHRSKRHAPLLVLAGTADTALKIHQHSNGGIPKLVRYQDTSAIPYAHIAAMVQLLQQAKQPVELRQLPGPHYRPLPADQPAAVWKWLSKHKLRRAPKPAPRAASKAAGTPTPAGTPKTGEF